jgi:catechol 2,3-dioxygenase-like lactoylglutathione lyase family enzyme
MSDRPLFLRGIDHIVLRCTQLEPMLTFYQEVLGMPLVRSNEELGLYHLRAGAALIDLVPVGGKLGGTEPPDHGRANMAHFCLRIDEPDWPRVLDYLREQGLDPGQPGNRFGADGSGPSVYITDPEGNTVELKGETES